MENIPVKPNKNMVVLRKDEVQTQTESGIYLPDSVKNKTENQGVVVASGPRSEDYEGFAPIGSRVVYNPLTRQVFELDIGNETFTVIPVDEIIAEI